MLQRSQIQTNLSGHVFIQISSIVSNPTESPQFIKIMIRFLNDDFYFFTTIGKRQDIIPNPHTEIWRKKKEKLKAKFRYQKLTIEKPDFFRWIANPKSKYIKQFKKLGCNYSIQILILERCNKIYYRLLSIGHRQNIRSIIYFTEDIEKRVSRGLVLSWVFHITFLNDDIPKNRQGELTGCHSSG